MQLSFETIRNAWDILKTQRADQLGQHVPGLTNPAEIFMKRLQDDGHFVTFAFCNLEAATDTPERTIPALKRAIQMWLRSMSTMVQILRSDFSTLTVRVDSNPHGAEQEKLTTPTERPRKYESVRPRELTNIMRVTEIKDD